MRLSVQVGKYIEGLTIGQGRRAGQSFKLHGWQRRFLAGAFKQPDDAALSMGRGGGKTTFCAAIACAAVDVGGPLVEKMAETLLIASSFDQGLIAFRHILHFLRPSLDRYGVGPSGRFRIQDSSNRATIQDRKTGALLRVLGSDPRRLHGAAPKLLLLDEISQWPPERVSPMLAALRTSRGKIPGSRALWLGTRPAAENHPFQRALDGHGVGFRMSYAAPGDANPFRKATWRRANPSLPHLPDLEAVIRSEAADARRDPAALASFRALRLNQGVSDTVSSVLIDPAAWRAAMGLPAAGQRSPDYVLGIDLGQNAAMSAAAAYFRTCELEAGRGVSGVAGPAGAGPGRWGGRPVSGNGGPGRVDPGRPAGVRRGRVDAGMSAALGPAGGHRVRPMAGGRIAASPGVRTVPVGRSSGARPGLQGWRGGRAGVPGGDPGQRGPARVESTANGGHGRSQNIE